MTLHGTPSELPPLSGRPFIEPLVIGHPVVSLTVSPPLIGRPFIEA